MDISEWNRQHPREAFAMEQLPTHASLRQALELAILNDAWSFSLKHELSYFALAVDHYHQVVRENQFVEPFQHGLRCEFPATILAYTFWGSPKNRCYRVEFQTNQGWSGYFITKSPSALRILKSEGASSQRKIVAGVERRITRFYVQLDDQVKVL